MLKELKNPLRLSFIGGGINSSIGKMHFMASQLDKNFLIESGFFSRDKKTNIETQKQFNININRIYNNLDKLLASEKKKVDLFVVLAPTPNHYKILKKLILNNVNIVVEKPILSNFYEVKKLNRYLKGFKKNLCGS